MKCLIHVFVTLAKLTEAYLLERHSMIFANIANEKVGHVARIESGSTLNFYPFCPPSRGLESVTQILESLTNAANIYERQNTSKEQSETKEQHLK